MALIEVKMGSAGEEGQGWSQPIRA
jgi:hypothetical protein